MKVPRDISAKDLVKAFKTFGYQATRQTGSHIRLSTSQNGEHHITIPNHSPIKIGTLSAILNEVATHFQMSKDELIKLLF
jgi:predicted RNA binding protein YcfA (HicA-like mRNA interferase family)